MWCWFVVLLLASQQLPAWCGSQVDESGERCKKEGIECPRDAKKSYEKYCCFESSNGVVSCCNPYFALELGVGIGVPLVILIIICMIITYCCCSYRQRRRERNIYYGEYEDEEELVNASSFKENKNDELPPYSEADPYREEPPEYNCDDDVDQSTTNDNNDDNVNVLS